MNDKADRILDALRILAEEMRNLDGPYMSWASVHDLDLTIGEWSWCQRGVDLAINTVLDIMEQP